LNGASFFFVCVYAHLLRGVYYVSYDDPRDSTWVCGIIIIVLMIVTAFTGYVLPWGQMGY
jgi:quinol-cytochrome oxidoreductase complex cytochrome b subunit